MAVLNVKEAGADSSGSKPCDDVVQGLISKLNSDGGGVLYFPAGYYAIRKTLKIETSIAVRGDSPYASILKADDQVEPVILIGSTQAEASRGAQVADLTIRFEFAPKRAIDIHRCAWAIVSNVSINYPMHGLHIEESNAFVTNLTVTDQWFSAVRVVNVSGDVFLSRVNSNSSYPETDIGNGIKGPYGAYLTNASGVQFTDCDFMHGRFGVVMDDQGSPNVSNKWVKFTAVSCDSNEADAWHIQEARGLQLSNCWSGSFKTTGLWLGEKAVGVTIWNHQFRNGPLGIDNHSTSCQLIGGVIGRPGENGAVQEVFRTASDADGWPRIVNLLGYN